MKFRGLLSVCAVTLCTLLASESGQARTAMPSDGSPYPANAYGTVDYYWGQVTNTSTTSSLIWDLTAHLDTGGTKSMTIRLATSGGSGQCISCAGVSVDANGGVAVGSQVSYCSTSVGQLVTPSVTVGASGYFMAECVIPRKANSNAWIYSYYYNQ